MPYVSATFSCPICRSPLRLRERPAGTLHLPCPDCGTPLELTDQGGELLVRPVKAVAESPTVERQVVPRRRAATAAGPRSRGSVAASAIVRHLNDPLVVTWLVAGIAAGIIGLAFLTTGRSTPHVAANESSLKVASDETARDAPIPEVASKAVVAPKKTATENVDDPVEPTDLVTNPSADATLAPVVATKPPASPPVDARMLIAERLSQRVLRFEQSTPVAFDVLRNQIEEMSGVRMRYDAALHDDSPERTVEMTLSIADSTIEDVLREAVARAGLSFVVERDGVRLIPEGHVAAPDSSIVESPDLP